MSSVLWKCERNSKTKKSFSHEKIMGENLLLTSAVCGKWQNMFTNSSSHFLHESNTQRTPTEHTFIFELFSKPQWESNWNATQRVESHQPTFLHFLIFYYTYASHHAWKMLNIKFSLLVCCFHSKSKVRCKFMSARNYIFLTMMKKMVGGSKFSEKNAENTLKTFQWTLNFLKHHRTTSRVYKKLQ